MRGGQGVAEGSFGFHLSAEEILDSDCGEVEITDESPVHFAGAIE